MGGDSISKAERIIKPHLAGLHQLMAFLQINDGIYIEGTCRGLCCYGLLPSLPIPCSATLLQSFGCHGVGLQWFLVAIAIATRTLLLTNAFNLPQEGPSTAHC